MYNDLGAERVPWSTLNDGTVGTVVGSGGILFTEASRDLGALATFDRKSLQMFFFNPYGIGLMILPRKLGKMNPF